MTRAEILEAARKCVCGGREQDYGTPENNFSLIASLWTAYNGREYTAKDVAMMLALLKVARISNGDKADSFVDLAGYAACAGEIATAEVEKAETIERNHYEKCARENPECLCNSCKEDHLYCCSTTQRGQQCPITSCAHFKPEE